MANAMAIPKAAIVCFIGDTHLLRLEHFRAGELRIRGNVPRTGLLNRSKPELMARLAKTAGTYWKLPGAVASPTDRTRTTAAGPRKGFGAYVESISALSL